MAQAVVVQVVLEPASDSGHRGRILEEFVIPELAALPGYRTSIWLRDGARTGTSIVLFDSAAEAEAGLAVLTRDGGPEVISAGVHTVELEA